jgi:hypothetical protein
MKEVGDVRIFERTIRPTFKAEEHLSTQTLRDIWGDLPAEGPRLDIRARSHCFASSCLEIRDSDLRQGQEMTGSMGPSYLIPFFPREQSLENLLGPRRVLLRYTRMPPI